MYCWLYTHVTNDDVVYLRLRIIILFQLFLSGDIKIRNKCRIVCMALGCVCVCVRVYEHVDNNRDIFYFVHIQLNVQPRNTKHYTPQTYTIGQREKNNNNSKRRRRKRILYIYHLHICGNSSCEDACQNMVMGHNDVLLP
jgi:hypothetical protein